MEVSQGWGGEGLSQDMVDRYKKCGGQSGVMQRDYHRIK